MDSETSDHDHMRPPELKHDTIWRDAGYWLALQGRFVAASPLIGGGVLAILIGGIVLEHTMVVRMLVATGMITDALVKHHGTSVETAVSTLAVATLLFLAGILCAWFGRYAYQILWRTYFTKHLLARWLADNRYLHLEREGKIDNPEQRIQEDLYAIGFWTVWLIPFFVGAISSGTYAWVLIWQMSYPLSFDLLGLPVVVPLGLFSACLVTSIVRVLGAHLGGRRMTRFEIVRKQLDADFRHELAEVREFGETIAFQRGAAREEQRALALFDRIRANWWRLTGTQMTLSTANGITMSLSRLIPPIVCIQPILAGQLTIGQLVVASATFMLGMQLIGVLADEYMTIVWLRSSVARIRLFERVLGEPRPTGPHIDTGGEGIAAENLAIRLPDGTPLLALAGLAVAPGERLAISGRAGSGKSTLLRTLAGLWPYAEGTVSMPAPGRTAFLPQRPYLPNDTLAAVLSYPDDPDSFDRGRYGDALTRSGLPMLAGRLDEIAPWRKMLSPGEQQRLAIARTLLRQPDFVVMDEPTSALDPVSEVEIFRALDAALPNATFVTVAHSHQLLGLHARQLDVANGAVMPMNHPLDGKKDPTC